MWHLLEDPTHVDEAKVLMASLVSSIACGWQMRFVDVVHRFPLRLLSCLEAPPSENCPRRKAIVIELLNRFPLCLQ